MVNYSNLLEIDFDSELALKMLLTGVLVADITTELTLLFRCTVAFLLINLLAPVIVLTGAATVKSAFVYANFASHSDCSII